MSIKKEIFICIDTETTGLDVEKDKIIEIAIIKFTFSEILDSFTSLVDPKIKISKESQNIHHISDDMIEGKPTIEEVLPKVLKIAKNYPIVGHGIAFDIDLIQKEASLKNILCLLKENLSIDTLRLSRLYGKCSVNSLEKLREHFEIEADKPHRAFRDASVNIEVFKQLSYSFKTLKEILDRLKNPISMKIMPLGRYKGREFKDIPLDYLIWASNKDFDRDLLFSIKREIKKRKNFSQETNPFLNL